MAVNKMMWTTLVVIFNENEIYEIYYLKKILQNGCMNAIQTYKTH